MRQLPPFPDLRAFLHWLEGRGDMLGVDQPVELRHEMTALQLGALRAGGPALRFDHAHTGGTRARMPVVANLFGTRARVAAGLGMTLADLPMLGEVLAALRAPAPVEGVRDALSRWPMLQAALRARPRICRSAPVQEARDIADLTQIPAQTPWPLDAGPLITWPVVITRPHGTQADQIARYNLGVYRAQVLGPDRLILRWLAHRGGAAIASGLDDTLLTRAAGVQLKERRPLVLLAREAPLTLAHLRNMTAVTEMGGIILPPVPAFYLKPDNVQAITAQIAARAVDLLRLGAAQANAWQG